MVLWRAWKYKNLTIWFASIIAVVLLVRTSSVQSFLLFFSTLGYAGALVAGILFVSTFTVSIGVVMLAVLARSMPILDLAAVAGYGAVLGDFFIFHFIQDNLVEELGNVYKKFGGNHISSVLHSGYFSWTLPVLGAIIIASPFPDELGITLMGISRMKPYKFILLSFVLNSTGIFLALSTVRLI